VHMGDNSRNVKQMGSSITDFQLGAKEPVLALPYSTTIDTQAK